MVARQDTDDDSNGGSGSGRLLMVIVLVLAVAATTVLVLADNTRWLRMGVLAALWAALFGVLLAVRFRKLVADRENEVSDLQSVYELELEREVAARREYELEVEAEARKRVEESGRADLAELRSELHALRESLERLTGGEVLVERFALQARSTRMRALAENQPRMVTAEPTRRGISAAQRPTEPPTELITRPTRSAAGMPPVARPTRSVPEMPPVARPTESVPGMAPVARPTRSVPGMAPARVDQSVPGMAPVRQTSPVSRGSRSVPGMSPVVRASRSIPGMAPVVRPEQSVPGMVPASRPGMAPVSRPDMTPVSRPGMAPVARPPQPVPGAPAIRRDVPQRPGGYRPEPSRPQTPRDGAIEDTGSRRELPAVAPPPNHPAPPQGQPRQAVRRPQQQPQRPAPQQPMRPMPNVRRQPPPQNGQPPREPAPTAYRDVPPAAYDVRTQSDLAARLSSDWPPPQTGGEVSRPNAPRVEPPRPAQHAAQSAAERTQRAEPVSAPVPPEPTRHGVADGGQHQDWQSYREWRSKEDAKPHHTGPPSNGWHQDPETTGAHTAGRSVTELLAAHGNQEAPSRHRRRAD